MTPTRWIVVVVVVGGVSYASGHYQARTETPPGEAEERVQEAISVEETREVQAEEVVAVTRAEAAERIVYRERVVYREGPVQVVEREVEASRAQVELELQAARVERVVEIREVVVEREVERRVEVERALPDWRVSGLVGADWRAGLVYGAQVERRILGPVYVGAWGLSSGAVGLGVGFGFP